MIYTQKYDGFRLTGGIRNYLKNVDRWNFPWYYYSEKRFSKTPGG
jgi:hypothetical protein